jgi:hypothetical protein
MSQKINRVALALELYRKLMRDPQKPRSYTAKHARDCAVILYGLTGSEQTGLDEEIAATGRKRELRHRPGGRSGR